MVLYFILFKLKDASMLLNKTEIFITKFETPFFLAKKIKLRKLYFIFK